MKKLLLLMLGVSFSSIAAPADLEYDNSGAYFNLGAGWGYISNLPTGTFAGSAAVGDIFIRFFGIEAAWAGLTSQQLCNLSNYNLYTMNLKGSLPVTEQWSFYGKAGTGAGYSSWSGTLGGNPAIYQSPGSASSWVAQATVGTSFALGEHFNIYLENSSYFPLATDAGSFSTANATFLGFQYNFSAPKKTAAAVNSYSQNTPLVASPTIVPTAAIPSAVEGGVIVATPAVTAAAAQTAAQPPAAVAEPASPLLAKNSEFQSRIKTDDSGRQYVVIKNGETLYRMSVNSGVSQTELRQINHLKGNTLVSGRWFYLQK